MKHLFIIFLGFTIIQHTSAIDLKKAYDGLRIEMSEKATAQRTAALAAAATDPRFATTNSYTSTEPSPEAYTTLKTDTHNTGAKQKRQLARAQTIPIHTPIKK